MDINNTNGYRAILDHYRDRTTLRSKVPLMNHINEGLVILKALNSSDVTKEAWCIHPIVQADLDLVQALHSGKLDGINSTVIMLAMEYRAQANAWLSNKVYKTGAGIAASDSKPRWWVTNVQHMLIADKVQNAKDFVRYHTDHPRFTELTFYFLEWLECLGVSKQQHQKLRDLISPPSTHEDLDYV